MRNDSKKVMVNKICNVVIRGIFIWMCFAVGILVVTASAYGKREDNRNTKTKTKTLSKYAVTINVKKLDSYKRKDCTVAFQEALDKASKAGNSKRQGRVIVPKGTYYLKGTLLIGSNVYVQCDKDAKIIKKKSNFAYMVRSKILNKSNYNGVSNVTIKGGTWDADYRKYTSTVGGSNFCFVHGENIKILDATICHNYSTHLIEFAGVRDSYVTGCNLYGYKTYDEKIKKEAIQLDIVHSTDTISRAHPYDDTVCQNIKIINNKIYDFPRGIGTHSAVKDIYNKNILILRNEISNLTAEGIYLYNFANVKILDNSITNVGKGILMKSSGENLYNAREQQKRQTLPNENYNILIQRNNIVTSNLAGSNERKFGIQIMGEANRYVGGIRVFQNTISSLGEELSIYMSYVKNCNIQGNACNKAIKTYGIGNTLQAGGINRLYKG